MSKKIKKGQVNQRQRLAVLLISSGVSQRETAEIVGVQEETVSRWKRQEAFKKLLEEKSAEVESEVAKARDILIEGAVLAALKELDSLKSDDEAIALRAAGEILDRVGIGKTTKIEQSIEAVIDLTWGDGDGADQSSTASSGSGGGRERTSEIQSPIGGEAMGED